MVADIDKTIKFRDATNGDETLSKGSIKPKDTKIISSANRNLKTFGIPLSTICMLVKISGMFFS